jgi:hypothetical protein
MEMFYRTLGSYNVRYTASIIPDLRGKTHFLQSGNDSKSVFNLLDTAYLTIHQTHFDPMRMES